MQMSRFDEELVCADSMAHRLKSFCGCHDVKVHREQNDPPDFWFDINGKKYAAEVTSIVTGQGHHAACTAFKDAVKNSAINEGCIIGSYCLQVKSHPKFPRKHSAEWNDLCNKTLSFIRDTGSKETTEEVLLLDKKEGPLSIRKIATHGATVGLFGAPGAKWEGEIQNELQVLIQDAVTTKRKKLESKGVPKQCPRIFLVLYDAYGYGDAEDARKALISTKGYDWFHSVFWATSFTDRENVLYPGSPGREGTFLHSKTDKWLNS